MAKYFTLKEMTYSDTAKKLGITNEPSPSIKAHLEELMLFLDGLREAWGSGIKVTSGYRCAALNKAVKGSSTSAHLYGYATDLTPVNGKMEEFKKFCAEWIKDKSWDQLLLETSKQKNGEIKEWVHLGLKNKYGLQRKQIKLLNI